MSLTCQRFNMFNKSTFNISTCSTCQLSAFQHFQHFNISTLRSPNLFSVLIAAAIAAVIAAVIAALIAALITAVITAVMWWCRVATAPLPKKVKSDCVPVARILVGANCGSFVVLILLRLRRSKAFRFMTDAMNRANTISMVCGFLWMIRLLRVVQMLGWV